MKRILYTVDGALKIIVPSSKSGMTILQIAEAVVPVGVEYRIVDTESIPEDRHFRNAWIDENNIDIDKAREVQKDHIRVAREPIMKALDIEQMRGNDVSVAKQELRDFTDKVNGVSDLDELKLILPKETN